jgi:hypothetical protein
LIIKTRQGKIAFFWKYPEISLANARGKREEYRKLIKTGINPSQQKKQSGVILFSDIAKMWFDKNADRISVTHKESIDGLLTQSY